jgi:flagellar protein FliO/FliZ
MTQNILQIFIGLIAVIALFLATAWLMRKFAQGPGVGGKQIQLLAGLSLGTKEKVLLVDAGGQQLLLGVTSHQISTLHTYAQPVVDLSEKSGASDFALKLQSFLKKTPISSEAEADSAAIKNQSGITSE